ncbi:MAG: PstS family phosphate ABC transporter substrate-binding protein [Nitrospira sp.]|nr:PstS family phosphate ABC transporter substrate-binding protein [Nitrospira sp.]
MLHTMLKRGVWLIGACALAATVDPAAAEQGGPFASLSPDNELARYTPQSQVKGSLKIQGSETMYPLLSRLSLEFQRRQPNVRIEVRGGGSSKAIEEFLQPPLSKTGKVMLKEERSQYFSLVATSRELFDSELKEFVAQHNYEPMAVPVAVDAVAIYVHKENPLTALTLEQVDAMFSSTRLRGHKTPITQWGQLGLSDGWTDASIQLYGRDRKSGTRAFFQEHCLGGGEFIPAVHENPGAASVILSLSRDQLGIGYSGLGLESSIVRAVPLAEAAGMPFVSPSPAAVADQSYPLRRILYLYLDKSPKTSLPPAAQEFLVFLMSQDGQQAVVKAGFFPLPAQQINKSAVALDSAAGSAPVRR